ncbi:DNA repair protein RecO [Bacillus massiliglaciei]|uniref:DNA repair protein RecO n=1 Tax=Bacillus massiliglaciei TaxID=1816693 RepID=UPI000A4B37B1|nr:DNA repair protein RecO [Bacillus massiliglaciei]
MLQKCEGIVIRRTDYGENNKIITIYTREFGKIGVMARGASKPNSRFASATQLFCYGFFLVTPSSGLRSLQQAELADSMRYIREDLYATAYASYIVELLDRSVEDKKPSGYLFELLHQTLHYINEEYDPEVMKFIFEMKMLPVNGISPTLNHCAVCGETEGEFSFSFREGGLICHRCLGKDPRNVKMSAGAVRLLRVFYYMDLSRLGTISVKPETKKEIKKIIDTYYEEYSGLHLKSKKFLNQLDSMKDLF